MLKRRSRALCVAVGVARTAHKLQTLRGLATLAVGCRLSNSKAKIARRGAAAVERLMTSASRIPLVRSRRDA